MNQSNRSHCLNCQAEITENYCSVCGQSAKVQRITFRETLDDFFSSSFALEGQLLSTIKLMVVNPGLLLRSFIAGKRKSYYKPVAFFVLLSAVYLIVRSVLDYDPLDGQVQLNNADESSKLFKDAARFMVTHINHIMFFLVFAIGFSNKLFFYRKYNLAEYLTVGFYVSGIYILVGLVQMLFSLYVFFIASQINMVILFFYLLYVSFSLHQKKSFLAILKYLMLSLTVIFFYMLLGFGFSIIMVS
ncbi:MAG: DUF3667 domain-containing protein [Ekhidna sp.]